MRLDFSEFNPDQPGIKGGNVVENVLPYAQGYGPLRDLQAFTGALSSGSKALSSVWALDTSGTAYNHAGTATRLEELQTADLTWNNVSIAGNYTGATCWEWGQYGDRLIAVDIANTTQYFDLGTSSLYANLAGSPPKAKHIGVVRNFVVMGNVDQSGTVYPNRLVWSGYNNTEIWTPSRATQSDQRDLRGEHGAIQRIVGGQNGVVFQRHAVSLMRYVGPPVIFNIDVVDRNRGLVGPKALAVSGQNIFYLSDDGFYMFTIGQGSRPIGVGRVDRYFFSQADEGSIKDVQCSVDPRSKMVLWAFKSSSGIADFDRVIVYNWGEDKWGWGEIDIQELGQYASGIYTLEDLDAVSASLDALGVSLDSAAWNSDLLSITGFTTDYKMATFTGSVKDAMLQTPEIGETRGLMEVRPLVSGSNPTITISHRYRNQLADNPTQTTGKSLNAKGTVNFRNNARFNRFRVNLNGDFNVAVGLDVDFKQTGRR